MKQVCKAILLSFALGAAVSVFGQEKDCVDCVRKAQKEQRPMPGKSESWFEDASKLIAPDTGPKDWVAEPCGIKLGSAHKICQAVMPLYQQKRFQEAAWMLEDQGHPEIASLYLGELEKRLKESDVEKVKNLGGGISDSRLVTLAGGLKAVFRPDTNSKGVDQRMRNELFAYKLDRLLGLNKVPMSVERVIGGKKGSLQYYVQNAKTAVRAMVWGGDPEIALFDNLIGNNDRHRRNFLLLSDSQISDHRRGGARQVAIDNDHAFSQVYDKLPDLGNSAQAKQAEISFYRRLKALDVNKVDEALKGVHLNQGPREFHSSRDRMLRQLCEKHKQELNC